MTALRLDLMLCTAIAALTSTGAQSAIRLWPSATCSSTLQACIDASASADTVQIATDTPVAESLSITRSITLEGADSFSAQMATGFSIIGTSSGSAAYNVIVREISLSNGRVQFLHESSGTANITVSQVNITGSNTSATGIRVLAANSGNATIRISDNRMQLDGPVSGGSAVSIGFNGATGSAAADFNHIETTGGMAWGISTDSLNMSTVTLNISNNDLRGRFGLGAIGITEGRTSTIASNVTARIIGNVIVSRNRVGAGIAHYVVNGSITTKTVNNTTVNLRRAIGFERWIAPSTGTIGGTVLNNLITRNFDGLYIDTPFQAAVMESNNLLFDNVSNLYTPSASDITSDPLLRSFTDVRLRAGSPAINAANSLATIDVIAAADLAQVDADGLRRFKAVQADIGAYEFGDISLRAKAVSPVAGVFVISDPQINGNAAARLFTTTNPGANDMPPFITNTNTTGVWFSASAGNNWRIFNQNTTTAMLMGAQFNVFVPSDGGGTFVHTVAASAPLPNVTSIDNSALNNLPNRIVLATANWNPGAVPVGIYNPSTFSVGYLSPRWFVLNNDGAAQPVGAAFNIYAQDPSPNAYVHTATSGNIVVASTSLDHPLLNDTRCANVYVTPLNGGLNDTTFDVFYSASAKRWRIFSHNGVMPVSARFNVVIDAAQVAACNGVLFADGFED
jgi:hypothetical protein